MSGEALTAAAESKADDEAELRADDSLPTESNSIEKILDVRRRPDARSSERQSFSAQADCEFLCKYKGRAHVHARWLDAEQIGLDGRRSAQRLRQFELKRARGEVEPFNSACMAAERVIATEGEADEADEAGGGGGVRYLVKWGGLGYDQCTWEEASVVPAPVVQQFHARRGALAQRRAAGRAPTATEKEGGPAASAELRDEAETAWRGLPEGTLRGGRELREYQQEGLCWLRRNFLHGRSVILGDEMGLGKTAQAVAMLQCLRSLHGVNRPFLVVAPLSTLQHWERELHAWTWLDVVVFYGNKSAREVLLKFEWLAESHAKGEEPITHFDVCVTTYEMLLAASEPFRKVLHWGYLIVDEGHRLKNKDAKVLGVLNQLDCPHKLVLTGTPLQNNVSELFSLLHFLDPQHFLSLSSFLSQYGEIQSAEQVASLTRVLRPYLLRREKADVEVELLPLEEVLVYVEITQFQKRCYKAILEQNRKLLLRGADVKTGPSFNNVSMQLRHCCNHPYLIRGVLQAEALEDLEDAEFLSRLVQESSLVHAPASGKTLLLEKLLPRLQQQGHRVLLFSQFAMLLDVIEDFVRMSGYSYERIDGSVTGERRQNAIDRFSNPDSSTFIFLLGTRAGGVGINLTAADTVIIFDPDWNPQNDVQAQARCHRIGQTKQVRVYRLVTRDTYEMALYERANLKLGLEQALIRHGSYGDIDGEGSSDTSAGGSAALSAPEVERLIKVGAQRLFTDEHDEQMDRFSAETIDQILERCSTSKLVSTNKGRDGTFSTFAQATFVSNEGDESVDIQDPHFWVKMLGKEPEKLTAEAAMEEDSDKQRQPQRQSKKDGILRHSDLWSRKELASLHTGLNTFGYGVPETLRAAFTALRMRNDDEVRAASEWTVSIALECETELARVDDADVWKEGRSLRVWHYLKSGSPPAPGQSLQGVPEVVHAVPCAGESAFTTHVSRVQRQAAHTIGQLVSLRRLRSAVDNAASEGSTFSAPKVPPLVLRDSTQRKELTSAKRKREDGDLDVGGEDGLDPRHEVGKACDDVTAAHVSKLENAEVGCGEAENDKGDCNSDAESEGGDCDPDIFDEEGEEESTKRSPGISDAVLGQARGSERFGGTRTLTITSAEDTELLLGVYKYGFGSYERIFSDPVFSRVGKLFSESMEHGVTSDQTPRAQGWSSFITGCALRQLNRRLKHLMLLLPPWDEGVEWRRVAQRGRLEREAAFVRSLYPRSYERQAEYGMQPPSLHTESPAGGDGPSASRAKRAEAAEQRVQEKRALKQERALAREQRFQERVQEKARVRDLKAEERAAKFEEKAKEEKQRSQVQAKKNKTFSLLEKKDEDRQQAREKKRHCRIEAKEEKKRRVEAKEEKLRLRLAERRTQRDADRQAQEERRKQEKTFAHVKLCLAYSTESTVEEAVPIHHGFRRILVEYKPFVEPKPAYSNNHEWNVLLAKLEFGLQLKLGEGYKVRSSMGNGRWALVPYVTVSLVENNLQNDLCIEYLFCADGSGVYLALGLEAFKLKRALGSKAASRYLQEAKELLRQLGKTVLGHHCSSFDFTSRIDLRASGSPLPSSYEQGAVISQLYKKDAIPTEDELFAQLKLLFQVYEAVITDATWIAFLDKSKEKYSALAASSAPKDGQRFEAQSDDSDSELDFETVEHVVASPAMAASQTPLGLQKPPFGQHDELGGGPLNRAFQRRAFLTFAQAARSAMNSEEPASAGLSRSSSLHSPGKLSVGQKSTKGRGKGRGKVSRRSKAISRVAVARVGCYNCDATLDDEFGVSICWSIGCDQPDCGKWACHACAGIDGALDGESYDGEWFCKEHIAHTEPM
ncbi:hypothetical protein AB1Y20_003217 [Prymnesium parvum]|uniref:DNA helicase n=1 Tax=Prymnesium parvum TaxID=97485 RepID=A0AB34JDW8_PRYPA